MCQQIHMSNLPLGQVFVYGAHALRLHIAGYVGDVVMNLLFLCAFVCVCLFLSVCLSSSLNADTLLHVTLACYVTFTRQIIYVQQ